MIELYERKVHLIATLYNKKEGVKNEETHRLPGTFPGSFIGFCFYCWRMLVYFIPAGNATETAEIVKKEADPSPFKRVTTMLSGL
jgi:hypothetical protein